jgi:hypothetical protein
MEDEEQRSPVTDGITISFLRQLAYDVLISFKVRIQIDLGGHRVAWEMIIAPDTAIPIELDTTQKLILLAKEGELLVDSSLMARDFPILLEEETM